MTCQSQLFNIYERCWGRSTSGETKKPRIGANRETSIGSENIHGSCLSKPGMRTAAHGLTRDNRNRQGDPRASKFPNTSDFRHFRPLNTAKPDHARETQLANY